MKTNRRKPVSKRGIKETKASALRIKIANSADKPIHEGWHKLDGTPINDLQSYIFTYLAEQKKVSPDSVMEIMIGTDGSAHGNTNSQVKLMSVICFRKIGKGAHLIKRRETHQMNYFVKVGDKLNMEVNTTYNLAMHLHEAGIKFHVHLDLNPNQEHESFNVYTTIKGFFESLGFTTEYKPDSAAAMCAADWLL